MPMPGACLTMRSVSTMSSAPRLLANVAGAKSRAMRPSSSTTAAVLRASVSRSAGLARSGFMFGCMAGSSGDAPDAAEQRVRHRGRGLVRLGEVVEAGDGGLELRPGVAALARLQRVEAAAGEVVELVAQHVTDRAQLAAVAVARAQQRGDRVAAPVGEFREMH